MKVATLRLERTVHSHFFTPNTSSDTCTSRSWNTLTWQARRSPSRASRLVISEDSVGSSSPPPFRTLTRHWPQVPPPPQADGTKMPASASAPSSFWPVGVATSRSSLTRMCTSPCGTMRAMTQRITTAMAISVPEKTSVL
jgi:hypothetical protein